MSTKKLLLLSALILPLLMAQSARAQQPFEGVLTYTIHEAPAGGDIDSEDATGGQFNLVLSPELILFDELDRIEDYQPAPMMESSRIYVRLDHKDFVFLQNARQGLKVSKSDIVAMMEMMEQMRKMQGQAAQDTESGWQTAEEEVRVEATGETATIQGYTAAKYVMTNADRPGEVVETWLARDMNVEWGMLAEPWGDSAQKLFPDNMPLPKLLSEGGIPLLMEQKKDGRITHRVECTRISKEPIKGSRYELPSDVRLQSFQQMMMGGQ